MLKGYFKIINFLRFSEFIRNCGDHPTEVVDNLHGSLSIDRDIGDDLDENDNTTRYHSKLHH
jgi:hypothetical protein